MNRSLPPTPGFLRTCVLLALGCALGACKDASAPAAKITITPGSAELLVGESRQFTALGGGSSVMWSSTQPDVASVVQQTGFVQALKRGQTTINASTGGGSASAQVSVLAPAAIALSAPTADFTVPVGAADPAPKTIAVTNGGDRPLGNVTIGTIAYGAGQPTGWLTVTTSGATAPATVTLTPRVGTLGRGSYTAIVPVQAADVANSPQNIAVTFSIQAPASIALSRTTVPIPAIPGETKTETVNITNGGDVALSGLSAAITFTAGQPASWLTATLSATSAPSTLTLQATSGTLAVGTYTATVRIASTVAGVSTRNVMVQLIVSPGPSIVFTPAQVSANAANGTNAVAQIVQVTNGGGGTLSGLSLGTTTYGAGAANWLTAQLSGATAPANLTLSFASSALTTGTYTATVPVLSPVASNSPRSLQVTLIVGPPPNLSLNPTSVGFSGWGDINSGGLPGVQAVQVTNSGNSTALGGLAASIAYGVGASGWLNANFAGSATPTNLLLQPNTSNLPAGTYSATVTVSTTAGGVASKTVNVTYVVQTFTVHVYPHLNSCASGCHFSAGPSVLNSSNTAQNVYNGILPYTGSGTNGLFCNLFDPSVACSHGGGKYNGNAAMLNAITSWLAAGHPFK